MLELKEDLTSPCLLWETTKRGGHLNKTAVTLRGSGTIKIQGRQHQNCLKMLSMDETHE